MKTRTKLFLILYSLAILSSVLVIPYIYTVEYDVLNKSGITLPILFVIVLIQGGIAFGAATFFGLLLAEKTGFRLPLLNAWLTNKKIRYGKTALLSLGLGSLVGLVIILLDKFVFLQIVSSEMKVPLWQGFLACFYGGIAEEIFMRLFLMTLSVFIMMKVSRRGEPSTFFVWFSILFISILFGLGHLPVTSTVVSLTPLVVFRAIVLNGIGGIVFGWLYWKKGLESAIIAHFTADIFIQIIGPIF